MSTFGNASKNQSKPDRSFYILTIRIPQQMQKNLDRLARSDGDTISALVRSLLREGIKKREEAIVQ